MTDQERRHVADLLAAHDALIHWWCGTLITAHADLVRTAARAEVTASEAGQLSDEQSFVRSAALRYIKVPSAAGTMEVPRILVHSS